jgi:hypothetical protein
MNQPDDNTTANKADAGNGSYGIRLASALPARRRLMFGLVRSIA